MPSGVPKNTSSFWRISELGDIFRTWRQRNRIPRPRLPYIRRPGASTNTDEAPAYRLCIWSIGHNIPENLVIIATAGYKFWIYTSTVPSKRGIWRIWVRDRVRLDTHSQIIPTDRISSENFENCSRWIKILPLFKSVGVQLVWVIYSLSWEMVLLFVTKSGAERHWPSIYLRFWTTSEGITQMSQFLDLWFLPR